ncbi:MAG: hypothetical protein HZB83_04950 [Deltaproteobacteria bacterium]|nr:hypothetical protein [Deltaproteobacteria bacterium]
MEYDVTEKSGNLTVAEGLGEKLTEAASVIHGYFPFDQCAVYVWDASRRLFELKAYHSKTGGAVSPVESYGEDEGIAGLVKKTGGIAEAYTQTPGDTVWGGTEDKGLYGFKSVLVLPLMDADRFLGALYLKSGGKVRLPEKRREILKLAARFLVLVLKYGVISDENAALSERLKDTEARLNSTQKLVALGDMAAELAHEIKNPLVSIGGFAARLRKKTAPDSPGLEYIDHIIRETDRLEKMVRGAMRFLKESALELKPDDINEILEDTLGIFEEDLATAGITVVRSFHDGSLTVMVDREQMKIAFDNLIANAIQSMEHGGTLKLTTSRSGGWVVAEVADSGGGIDPRHIGHIFNPFFTTKEHGTGLGLPITNSIVMRHKGVIDVVNNAGVGVTFAVKLPASPRGALFAGRS